MARQTHTAWTPPSLPDSIVLLGGYDGSAAELTAETVPGNPSFRFSEIKQNDFFTGSGGFDLSHSGELACGIPDAGDTIVLTGGVGHNFVTRWVGKYNLFIQLLSFGPSVQLYLLQNLNTMLGPSLLSSPPQSSSSSSSVSNNDGNDNCSCRY